jgi:hypothetical protein
MKIAILLSRPESRSAFLNCDRLPNRVGSSCANSSRNGCGCLPSTNSRPVTVNRIPTSYLAS